MSKRKRPTPATTAKLILVNGKLYESERGREITRYRFSLPTLRRISGRAAIRQQFLVDLEDELAELGWLLISLGGEFGVMDLSKMDSWVKLSSKRIEQEGYFYADDEEIDDVYNDLFPPMSEDSADE